MPKVSRVMPYGFCSKFHTLSSSVKNFENRLQFDKVTESLKVGTFLRHSVVTKNTHIQTQLNQVKLKPDLGIFYAIEPGNISGLSYSCWGLHWA